MKNPLGFAWEIGQYQNPNVVIPPNGPVPAVVPIPCPGKIVIYASDIGVVANCAGPGLVRTDEEEKNAEQEKAEEKSEIVNLLREKRDTGFGERHEPTGTRARTVRQRASV
jgi:hypothetical protein